MFYACGVSVCDGGNKKASFWLPAKKAQNACRAVVTIESGHSVFQAVLSRHHLSLFPAIFVIFQNPQIPSFSFLNHVFIIPKFPLSCDFQNVGLGTYFPAQKSAGRYLTRSVTTTTSINWK